MNEIKVVTPTVTATQAKVLFNFDKMDANIDFIKSEIDSSKLDDKETKKLCADLNKLSKAINDEGISIEKKATEEVIEFRAELKKRTDRIKGIRDPLWDKVKPMPKPTIKEPIKVIEKIYWFKGDEKTINKIIEQAQFADIEVKEVEI